MPLQDLKRDGDMPAERQHRRFQRWLARPGARSRPASFSLAPADPSLFVIQGNNVISAEFGAKLSALLKEINMHFVKAFIAAIAIGLISPVAIAQTAMTSPQEFVKAAATSDMLNRLSELALRNRRPVE